MAVVKATFTKSRGGAKASIRYIAFRPGKKGEEMARQLFGHDGPLSLSQADRIVDEAKKGTNFFRLVLSPDPALEDRLKDLDMWEFARQTVLKLEGRLKKEIQFVAAEHNDHTPIRHVHLIAAYSRKTQCRRFESFDGGRDRGGALSTAGAGPGACRPAAGKGSCTRTPVRPNGLPGCRTASGEQPGDVPARALAA